MKEVRPMNPTGRLFELRDAAAQQSLGLLRLHRDNVLPPVARVLAYLEAHLFDVDLTIRKLKREAGLKTATVAAFQNLLGLPPKAYVESLRLRTAAHLLANTDVSISDVATLVGFSQYAVFASRWRKWVGQSPAEFRQWKQNRSQQAPASPTVTLTAETLEKALRDELDAEEIESLLQLYYAKLDPETQALFASESPSKSPFSRRPQSSDLASPTHCEELEKQLAEHDWQELSALPPEHWEERIRNGHPYRTPARFHLLGQKSREAGWYDGHRALELAQLAREHLASLILSGESRAELEALGHAWVGHAKSLLRDRAGTEHEFGLAASCLWGRVPQPLVEAEMAELEAHFCWFKQPRKAFALANRAIELFKDYGKPNQQAQALALRSYLHQQLGALKAAIADLLAAQALLTEDSPAALRHATAYHLARRYLETGELAKAQNCLREVRAAGDQLKHPFVRYRLAWLEGTLAKELGRIKEARTRLRRAFGGFRQIQQPGCAAMVGLELALLEAETGRPAEAIATAEHVLQLFSAYCLDQEAGRALKPLQNAVKAGVVSADMLREVRSAIARSAHDSTLR